jgi:hypothetical protein
MDYKSKVSFIEFKRRIADQLSLPWSLRTGILGRWQGTSGANATVNMTAALEQDASDLRLHILSYNKQRNSDPGRNKAGNCYLCKVIGLDKTKRDKLSTNMGCLHCRQCFHLECFNTFHRRHLNTQEFNDSMDERISKSKIKKPKKETVGDPASYVGGQ